MNCKNDAHWLCYSCRPKGLTSFIFMRILTHLLTSVQYVRTYTHPLYSQASFSMGALQQASRLPHLISRVTISHHLWNHSSGLPYPPWRARQELLVLLTSASGPAGPPVPSVSPWPYAVPPHTAAVRPQPPGCRILCSPPSGRWLRSW